MTDPWRGQSQSLLTGISHQECGCVLRERQPQCWRAEEEDCGKEGEQEKKIHISYLKHMHTVFLHICSCCACYYCLLMFLNYLFLLVSYLHTCVQYLQRPEEGIRSLGTGVTGGCELPCGCWELNPGPLEEQPVLVTTEPSLQPNLKF